MKKTLLNNFLTFSFVAFAVLLLTGFQMNAQCSGVPNPGIAVANPMQHTCQGTSTLNVQSSSMGPGILFQWEYSTDGVNWFLLGGPQPMPTISTGNLTVTTQFRVIVSCVTSGMFDVSPPVTVTINPGVTVTPTATMTASTGSSACVDDEITFTVTATNVGSTPTYQWQVNGSNVGTNSDTYVATAGSLSTNDNVSVEVTSSDPCSLPQTALASITMTIEPLITPTISIGADQTNICESVVVNFTATDNAPGGTYQWYRNGTPIGTNSPLLSYAPAIGDVVTLEFTPPAAGCYDNITVTSNAIPIDVTPGLPTLATIESIDGTLEGQQVTVYANLFNFSLDFTIDWFINNAYFATTTVPYLTYIKGPGTDDIFAVANNTGTGCYLTDTSNQISIGSWPTSVASTSKNTTVSAYPNPFSNSIQLAGLADGDHVRILNLMGQAVQEWKLDKVAAVEVLNINELSAGTYILDIHDKDGSLKDVIRLLKN